MTISTPATVVFVVSTGVVVASAWRLAGWGTGSRSCSDRAIAAGVLVFAIVVACVGAAGTAGHLTLGAVLVLEAAVFGASAWLAGRPGGAPPLPHTAQLPPAIVGVTAAFLMLAGAFAVWHAPLTLYDSLSYHLHFAARWVQDRAIAIVPTPFSDPAQAYAPGNGELVFAWLMLPFRSDLLARMGQLPFVLLASLVLYAIARRLGADPAHAAYPALLFPLSRPVAEQMIGANVDLICAAAFLAASYFALAAVDRNERRDWALFGIAAGLFCGTKYLALIYIPVLMLLAFARGPRARSMWALPGLLAFGLPWYARNWIEAGSPIYPASLTFAGLPLAAGAFTRDAMFNTVFRTDDLRLLPAIVAHAMGPALFVAWLPCALAGAIVLVRKGWWPHAVLVLVPIVMVPLYWSSLPVNIDSRFLMPAVGPALLPIAFLFSRSRRWNGAVHVLLTATALWSVVGLRRSLPGDLPWFMQGWLALDGLVWSRFLPVFAAAALIVAALWWVTRRWPPVAFPALALTVASGTAFLTTAATWCGTPPCAYLRTTPTYIRSGHLDSWAWIHRHVRHATIAYTGTNLPYPLTGERLTNRVVYVNTDGRPRWRLHEYDRAYRSGRFVPRPPLLAVSSGELRPVDDRPPGPRDDASRPRYERMHGNRDAWLFNLDTMDVHYLYVAQLSAYELDYVWHNERGFPIEDEWAAADAARFQLVYTNPEVHIYAVAASAGARG